MEERTEIQLNGTHVFSGWFVSTVTQVNGKRVKGYFSLDDGAIEFRPHQGGWIGKWRPSTPKRPA